MQYLIISISLLNIWLNLAQDIPNSYTARYAYFPDITTSFWHAEEICNSFDSHLATINSWSDLNQAAAACPNHEACYIGLRESFAPTDINVFYWLSDPSTKYAHSQDPYEEFPDWFRFISGLPQYTPLDQPVAVYMYNGWWYNVDGDAEVHFLCDKTCDLGLCYHPENIYECTNNICEYIYECTNNDDCGAGYNCNTNRECEDTNECEGIYECNENQRCVNTDGGYTCICIEGYHEEDDECVIDGTCETVNNRDLCDWQICQTVGTSHICTDCPSGTHIFYTGPRETECRDYNECTSGGNNCGQTNSLCKNLYGSYECIPDESSFKFSVHDWQYSGTDADLIVKLQYNLKIYSCTFPGPIYPNSEHECRFYDSDTVRIWTHDSRNKFTIYNDNWDAIYIDEFKIFIDSISGGETTIYNVFCMAQDMYLISGYTQRSHLHEACSYFTGANIFAADAIWVDNDFSVPELELILGNNHETLVHGPRITSMSIKTTQTATAGTNDQVTLELNWDTQVASCILNPNAVNTEYSCDISSTSTNMDDPDYTSYFSMKLSKNGNDDLKIEEFCLTDAYGHNYRISQFCLDDEQTQDYTDRQFGSVECPYDSNKKWWSGFHMGSEAYCNVAEIEFRDFIYYPVYSGHAYFSMGYYYGLFTGEMKSVQSSFGCPSTSAAFVDFNNYNIAARENNHDTTYIQWVFIGVLLIFTIAMCVLNIYIYNKNKYNIKSYNSE